MALVLRIAKSQPYEARVISDLDAIGDLVETLSLRVLEIENKIEILEARQLHKANDAAPISYAICQDRVEKLHILKRLLTQRKNMDSKLTFDENEDKVGESKMDKGSKSAFPMKLKNESILNESMDCFFQETEYIDDPQLPMT